MPDQKINILQFVISTALIILLLAGFIVLIIYVYQKKHFLSQKKIEEMKSEHQKNLLEVELEIQEETFEEISREIHDNVAHDLTVVKLYLNTLNKAEPEIFQSNINTSIELIGKSLDALRNISRSLSADFIKNEGLHKALENELIYLNKADVYTINYTLTGNDSFEDAKWEIFIFRIIQEALTNIIKHAKAQKN